MYKHRKINRVQSLIYLPGTREHVIYITQWVTKCLCTILITPSPDHNAPNVTLKVTKAGGEKKKEKKRVENGQWWVVILGFGTIEFTTLWCLRHDCDKSHETRMVKKVMSSFCLAGFWDISLHVKSLFMQRMPVSCVPNAMYHTSYQQYQ